MGLRGQNSWAEAGGRRQCEARLCSWMVMGTVRSIEKPLPFPLGRSPGFRASCLPAKESRRESPSSASAPRLAGDQQPGLPGLSQGLFAPPALLQVRGRTPPLGVRVPDCGPHALAQCRVALGGPPRSCPRASSRRCPGAQRRTCFPGRPPSVGATHNKDPAGERPGMGGTRTCSLDA